MEKQEKKHLNAFYWKKIYLKYFLKYMSGFFLVLAPCILIVFVSWMITREQVVAAGEWTFQEGMTEIASEISKMRILENDLQNSESLKILSMVEKDIPWGQYLYLQNAREQLDKIRYIYEFSPFYFVLFQENDLFVSPYQCESEFSKRHYGYLMEANYAGKTMDVEEFRSLVLGNGMKGMYSFVKLDSLSYFTTRKNVMENPILCIINKSHIMNSDSGFRTVYILSAEKLIGLLLTEECRMEGFVRITDTFGNILLDYGNTMIITECEDKISDVGSHWMVAATDVEETGWLVQVGIPKTAIYEKIQHLYFFVYGYIVLGFSMVIILAYYFGKKQYRELKNFYSLVPDKEHYIKYKENISAKHDEYDVLMKIFRHMAENSENYLQQKNELERQNKVIRLEKLIVGGISTQEEREELERANLLSTEFYCVAVMRMQVKEQLEYGMTLLAIKEYLLKNWSEKIFHIHTGIYDELFLFSLASDRSPDVNDVQKLFENTAQMLNEQMEVILRVGISTIGTDVSNIKRCYTQAVQTLEAYYHEEKTSVNCWRIDSEGFKDTIINMDFLNQLHHYIVHTNVDQIQKSFLLVKSYYCKHPVFFEAQKEQYFYSIRNVIYHTMIYFNEQPEENGILPSYDKEDSIYSSLDKLQSGAEWLIMRVNARKKEQKECLNEEVMDFVEHNFKNKNMSVNYVCGELEISERYLQTVIKEKTGDTFSVYLEKLRVKKAAELLLNTNLSNEQIADEVGFIAISTFYRSFNKRMGVSPKAFRQE